MSRQERVRALGWMALLLSGLVQACGLPTDTSLEPATIQISPSSVELDALGASETVFADVLNQDGAIMDDVVVQWSSSDPLVAQVSETGLVLASANGNTMITAAAGRASATVSVTVSQVVTNLLMLDGDGQVDVASFPLPIPLEVLARDRLGNPVVGGSVDFQVISGGGSVSPTTAATDTQGRASAVWTLGSQAGEQRASVTAGSAPPLEFTATALPVGLHIELQFLTAPTDAQRQAFENAALRWGSLITEKLPEAMVNVDAGILCGHSDVPAVDRLVDDLLIMVILEDIDGPGGTLGQAGPCLIRIASGLPVVGLVRLDTSDLPTLESEGQLETVILHEIGHVLGFGTLWGSRLQNPSWPNSPGADTHFNGPRAIQAFDAVGGIAYTGGEKVPVENEQGGEGARDAHWRESVLGNELMTGFLNPGHNPLSRISVASLADLGYEVDEFGADPFLWQPSMQAPRAPGESVDLNQFIDLGDDIHRGPIYRLDESGHIIDDAGHVLNQPQP